MKQVVVISGGSKGIGAATAQRFANAGKQVCILDQQAPSWQVDNCQYYACDVTDTVALEQTIAQIQQAYQQIDIVVSNAGIHFSATIEQTTLADFDRVMDVNLKSTFFLLRAVLPIMKQQQKGDIVIVSSDQAGIGKRNSAVYGASKAAIGQLAKSTALDYAEYGIRVNAVCPGTIDTPLYRQAIARYAKKSGEDLAAIEQAEAREQPVNRVGQAEEVAALIDFLCSGQADYITGALLPIDGGYTAH